MPYKLNYFVFSLLVAFNGVECQNYVQCNGVEMGMFVASNVSCKHFIYCDFEPYEAECDDNLYFDAVQVMCVEQAKANCTDEQNGFTSPTPMTTTATTVVATMPPNETSTTTNATTNTGPADIIEITTILDANNAINGFSSLLSTTPVTAPSDGSGEFSQSGQHDNKVIVANACPSQDSLMELVLVPNLDSCSHYYTCYQGQRIPMQCASTLLFNAQTGKCDYEYNVKCQTQNPSAQCASRATDLLAHPSNCNYYYQCRNGFLLMRQCPLDQGWDHMKRTCVKLHDAQCITS